MLYAWHVMPGIAGSSRHVHVGARHGPVRGHLRGGQAENGHCSGTPTFHPRCPRFPYSSSSPYPIWFNQLLETID